MSTRSILAALSFIALGAAACNKDIALGLGGDGGASCPVTGCGTTATKVRMPQSPQNKVDILFMVDNSFSMAAMQEELKAKFGDFFAVLTNLASSGTFADLHIGVVTSDYGAGDQDNSVSGCSASPGGDRGKLQAIGKAADPSCVAPTGLPYIEYAFGEGGTATGNLPGGNTPANLITTFTCMASGISADGTNGGCGFEHQLESVYAALHNTTDNAGFLRDDALLVVVFLTNEDDGSAAPTAKIYESGSTANITWGQYDTYRQTRWAVECNGALAPYASMADLTSCAGAPNANGDPGLAYDVSRYIDYFTQSSVNGGVKPDPNDVVLVAVDAPTTPFSTILAQVGTGGGATPTYTECAVLQPGSCDVHLQHSCQNMSEPAFFGDPAVRLNAVVSAAAYHQIMNICGDDLTQPPSYTNAMQNMGSLIAANIGQGCITAPVADPTNPDCVVVEVTPVAGGANQQVGLPNCATNGGERPCWVAEKKSQCAANALNGSPQGLGISVEYPTADGGVPTGSYLSVTCATTSS